MTLAAIEKRALSLGRENASSCPIPAVRGTRWDRLSWVDTRRVQRDHLLNRSTCIIRREREVLKRLSATVFRAAHFLGADGDGLAVL